MEHIRELTPAALMGLLGVAIILLIPSQIKQTSSGIIDSQFVPYLAAGTIVLCSLASILNTLIKRRKAEKEEAEEITQFGYLKVVLVFVGIGLWILLLPVLGYFIITLLITALTCIVFGTRNLLSVLSVSILFSVSSYYIFTNILKVSLPAGLLF